MTAAPEQRDRIEDSIDYHPELVDLELAEKLWADLTQIDHWQVYGDPRLPGTTTTAWFLTEFAQNGDLIESPNQLTPSMAELKRIVDELLGIESNQVQVNWYQPRTGAPRHSDMDRDGALQEPIGTVRLGAPRVFVADWKTESEKPLDPLGSVPDTDGHQFTQRLRHRDLLALCDNKSIKHGVLPGLGHAFGVTFRQHRQAS